jgi:hypothetical protein
MMPQVAPVVRPGSGSDGVLANLDSQFRWGQNRLGRPSSDSRIIFTNQEHRLMTKAGGQQQRTLLWLGNQRSRNKNATLAKLPSSC